MPFKVNKVKEYAILWCRHQGKTKEQISEELNVSESTVEQIYSDNPASVAKVKSKNEMSFERQKSGNTVLSAVLTKEGAAIGDEITANPPKRENVIFRPNG